MQQNTRLQTSLGDSCVFTRGARHSPLRPLLQDPVLQTQLAEGVSTLGDHWVDEHLQADWTFQQVLDVLRLLDYSFNNILFT